MQVGGKIWSTGQGWIEDGVGEGGFLSFSFLNLLEGMHVAQIVLSKVTNFIHLFLK